MKEWLSASEIAALGLPGLPVNKRNINVMAQREGWNNRSDLCRERTGRGGGLECGPDDNVCRQGAHMTKIIDS